MPTLYLFDNFDEPKGLLNLSSELTHIEQVKGIDQISFKTSTEPDKCDRILWRDEQDGCWREFVVKTVKKELGGLFEVVAESSLFELRESAPFSLTGLMPPANGFFSRIPLRTPLG